MSAGADDPLLQCRVAPARDHDDGKPATLGAEQFEKLHGLFGLILIVVLALHVAAALKHHLIDRDDTLRRMLGVRR